MFSHQRSIDPSHGRVGLTSIRRPNRAHFAVKNQTSPRSGTAVAAAGLRKICGFFLLFILLVKRGVVPFLIRMEASLENSGRQIELGRSAGQPRQLASSPVRGNRRPTRLVPPPFLPPEKKTTSRAGRKIVRVTAATCFAAVNPPCERSCRIVRACLSTPSLRCCCCCCLFCSGRFQDGVTVMPPVKPAEEKTRGIFRSGHFTIQAREGHNVHNDRILKPKNTKLY